PAVSDLLGARVSSPAHAEKGAGQDTRAPKVTTYGLSESADLRATNLKFDARGASFDVPGVGSFNILVPGEHNVRNALAAIGVARHLGVSTSVIAAGLKAFTGVDRRFQILGEYAGAIIVDDYAHHPTEIRATLNAARRGYPQRRIIALFQPHLYSRTRDFAGDFAASLRVADVALVAPIYAAREEPIHGITAHLIADAAEGIEFIDKSNEEIAAELRKRLRANDLFITMGAGDVHMVGEALIGGAA
ncbi:MAG TPA: cyanophycin synthetase, partial [Thermoanaerobaculia bacterium]